MYFTYILKSIKFESFYIGQTNDLISRLKKHNSGSVKSTKSRHPYRLVYFEEFKTRYEAMSRELEIKKKYNTERRRKLVSSFDRNILIKMGL